jgi:hypothetical protein
MRRHLFLEPGPSEDPPHTGEGIRGELSDAPLDLQLSEPIEGKDRIKVFNVPGVLGIVRDAEVGETYRFLDLPKR